MSTSWCRDLAATADRIAKAWGIELGAPLPGSTQGAVFEAQRPDGARLVLKLEKPGPGIEAQAAALRIWNGNGAVRLLACNPSQGALLLDRIEPGTSLAQHSESGRDEEATRIAARLMRRLAVPVPSGTHLADAHGWGDALDRVQDPRLPGPVLDRARGLLRDLVASAPAPSVLHGDLHHGNILLGAEDWVAIDPAGAQGDPLFEVGALLRNPIPWLARQPDACGIQARRLAVLAEELDAERGRIAAWGFVVAAISAAWAIEDGSDRLPDWLAALASLGPLT